MSYKSHSIHLLLAFTHTMMMVAIHGCMSSRLVTGRPHKAPRNTLICHASADNSSQNQPQNPWQFSYIQRERNSIWTDDNKVRNATTTENESRIVHQPQPRHPKARLIKLIASNQLSISIRELEYRLFELSLLVPDLARRLHTLQPTTLASLLTDTAGVATRLITLRELLPAANVGVLVARQPDILLQVRTGCVDRVCGGCVHMKPCFAITQ